MTIRDSNHRTDEHSGIAPLLLAGLAAAIVLGVSIRAGAICDVADPCAVASAATDCDQDGLSDRVECIDGVTSGSLFFPPCRVDDTVDCVEPKKLDLFVVWEKDSPSFYDSLSAALGLASTQVFDPFELPESQGGMDTNVHPLPAGSPVFVAGTQAAVVLTEDATDPGVCPVEDEFGVTQFNSNPNRTDNGILVFSGRIARWVECLFDDAGDTTTDRTRDKWNQLVRTTVHEMGHHTNLANESNSRFNGFHLRAGSGFTMDQTAEASIKRGVVTITSPRTFASPHYTAHQQGVNAQGPTHCGSPLIPCLPQP
jgi:hypothetical protein